MAKHILMKKFLTTLMLCLLFCTMQSQSFTEKSLHGLWKIAAYNGGWVNIDFIANTANLTEQAATLNPLHTLARQQESANRQLKEMRDRCLYFAPYSWIFYIGPVGAPSQDKYTLSSNAGKHYIDVDNTGPDEIYIKNGRLYWTTILGDMVMTTVYTKEQE